ncbi:SNF2 family N-terminal domain-containing protein [Cristinia sonorae]|uniref:SNF2 family N-terminal domain-containing protein n=1 Tax=Cristinia sonorae TaxID=1940300 RepID=A0A8K0XR35_9AGAR|nr:SNF2 family N-terminal domain-containing protein [Cristinia sonorae]
MERFRKALAEDGGLYPVAVGRPVSKGNAPASAISIASTDTDGSVEITRVVSNPLAKARSRHVIISDDEDEDGENPFNPQQTNTRPNAGPSRPMPLPATKPTVVLAPAKIPPYLNPLPRPAASNEEWFDLRRHDMDADPILTPAEAQKALQDLVAEVNEGEEHHEYTEEDTKVDGFRDEITLLPHQVQGRKWMAERESGKKFGGILADDMGLGKTIQTLVRIVEGLPSKADMKTSGHSRATLVICPVAVVGQWVAEIKKMTVGLRVVEHHGASRTTDPTVLGNAHVVVTSYSIVTSEHGAFAPNAKDESKSKKKQTTLDDSDDDSDDSVIGKTLKKTTKKKDALFRVKWWRIVLDEAHNIKNRTTKAAIACCALEAKYRWCLTGTPMQNNVEELYSLIKFLRLKPLNDWPTFKVQIAAPVKANKPIRAMKRLQVVLKAAMLRRTKTTVLNGKPLLDLPDRVVNHVHCQFDPEEQAFYDTVEERMRKSMEKLQQGGEAAKAYTSILVLLLRMRQACNHPSLVVHDYKKDKEAVDPKAATKGSSDDLADDDDLADMFGGLGLSGAVKHCQLCQVELSSSNKGEGENCKGCDDLMRKSRRKSTRPDSNLPPDSAKTRKVMSLLDEIEERSDGEEKTIIFSQFTSMLDLLEPFLKDRGIRYVRYDGSMNKVKREESLDKIKNRDSIKVILISFKAGSTGLNLTCCNNVILVDMWWNPALEDQAFDRAHRLGQTKNVNIYKLSVPNTVEERILELQEKKRALATAALSGDKLKNMRLGMDDLMALFGNHGDHDDED